MHRPARRRWDRLTLLSGASLDALERLLRAAAGAERAGRRHPLGPPQARRVAVCGHLSAAWGPVTVGGDYSDGAQAYAGDQKQSAAREEVGGEEGGAGQPAPAGLEALQRLHAEGRLALLPADAWDDSTAYNAAVRWRLPLPPSEPAPSGASPAG